MNTSTSSAAAAAAPTSDPASLCGQSGPSITPHHAWLERFVGDWEAEIEMAMGPDQPVMKTRGSDRCRLLGGLWLISEGKNEETPYLCRLTLGYSTTRRKYVGTWLDTMTTHLWIYEGNADPAGHRLVLETEGPSPLAPERLARFQEVTEFLSADHRLFTSSVQGEDGEWNRCLAIHFRRRRTGA